MEEQTTECLVCSAPLEHFLSQTETKCTYCHKASMNSARYINGHFICDNCHEQTGLRAIEDICRHTDSKDLVAAMKRTISSLYIYIHGPEHHVLAGSVLLATYKNAGGGLDLDTVLKEVRSRGAQVPGGICGLWGTCGAAMSTGIFVNLTIGTSSLSGKKQGLCSEVTSRSLGAIAKTGEPRCCRRGFYTVILEAVNSVGEGFGIQMERPKKTACGLYGRNEQCLKEKCPYDPQG